MGEWGKLLADWGKRMPFVVEMWGKVWGCEVKDWEGGVRKDWKGGVRKDWKGGVRKDWKGEVKE